MTVNNCVCGNAVAVEYTPGGKTDGPVLFMEPTHYIYCEKCRRVAITAPIERPVWMNKRRNKRDLVNFWNNWVMAKRMKEKEGDHA